MFGCFIFAYGAILMLVKDIVLPLCYCDHATADNIRPCKPCIIATMFLHTQETHTYISNYNSWLRPISNLLIFSIVSSFTIVNYCNNSTTPLNNFIFVLLVCMLYRHIHMKPLIENNVLCRTNIYITNMNFLLCMCGIVYIPIICMNPHDNIAVCSLLGIITHILSK